MVTVFSNEVSEHKVDPIQKLKTSAGQDAKTCYAPYVIELERSFTSENNLVDITETYEDILQKYGILLIRGLAKNVMKEKVLDSYQPEKLWTAFRDCRIESVRRGGAGYLFFPSYHYGLLSYIN